MILERIIARNFRNLVETPVEFHPRANLLFGDNGQGKTNLLEAIYFLATTKSFRTAHLQNLVRIGCENVFVQGTYAKHGLTRTLAIGLEENPDKRRRQLLLNGQPVPLRKFVDEIHLFAYAASRLEIIRGGPGERRRFLDRGIASLEPEYVEQLSQFQRTLKQRNLLLRHIGQGREKRDALDPWDEELLTTAIPLVAARSRYADALTEEFHRVVDAHHYHVDELSIAYQPSGADLIGASRTEQKRLLSALRSRELQAGFSLFGPQRDEVQILLGGQPASEILSSGEVKMTVLFLKFAKLALYRKAFAEEPLFLLDDVDAELDPGITERLLAYLTGSVQLFLTSAKEPLLRALVSLGDHGRFQLRRGMAEPMF